MAARIIFCIEGIGACQYPSRVWDLAETGPVKGKPSFQGKTDSAWLEGKTTYRVRCSEAVHADILREAIREQADPNSTACYIALVEDRPRGATPVFHVERVTGPSAQAFFDTSWNVLLPESQMAA